MTCAVCIREARGFGYVDPSLRRGDTRRDTARRQFCSMRCQRAFSQLMQKTEGRVIDPTEMEQAAMASCLAPLGEYVATVDMQRPLADYRREEVLTLIEVVVTAYQAHMLEAHERLAEQERAYFAQQTDQPSGRAA